MFINSKKQFIIFKKKQQLPNQNSLLLKIRLFTVLAVVVLYRKLWEPS